MFETSEAIELEVFKNLFAAVAEEMGVRLMRSAYSPNIKERRDFSCALFDADAEMVAQAAHIPVHLGSTPMSVRAAIDAMGPAGLERGDRVILNDPFDGGTHLPDITLVAPCYIGDEERPRFYVANRAHHADVGGITPGSMPLSTHIDQEGVRISPTRLDAETMEWVCSQSRTGQERRGDLNAQLAAAALGIERLEAMCQRYGAAEVTLQADRLQDYSERMVRAALAEMPDGRWHFTDLLDGDGIDSVDIPISCALTIEGESVTVDFSESADQVRGSVNAVRAITVSAVSYALRCLLPESLPSNGGAMRPVEVVTRPGSVVDALPPAAVAAGNVETSQRLVDVVFGALAQALPERVPAASCGSMNNVTIGGLDPRTGRQYAYYETLAGGAGAAPGSPGASALHTHMTNTLNTPVEALEHAFPFRVEAYRIRSGSGGPGHQAGGDGLERVYAFDHPARLTLLTERRSRGPYGLNGGTEGGAGANILIRDGVRSPLPAKVSMDVLPGDKIVVATPGGGGHGCAKRS